MKIASYKRPDGVTVEYPVDEQVVNEVCDPNALVTGIYILMPVYEELSYDEDATAEKINSVATRMTNTIR